MSKSLIAWYTIAYFTKLLHLFELVRAKVQSNSALHMEVDSDMANLPEAKEQDGGGDVDSINLA